MVCQAPSWHLLLALISLCPAATATVTFTYTRAHSRVCPGPWAALSHVHTLIGAHTYMHMHILVEACMCVHTLQEACTHAHTHGSMHAHLQKHTQALAHTHKHLHTQGHTICTDPLSYPQGHSHLSPTRARSLTLRCHAETPLPGAVSDVPRSGCSHSLERMCHPFPLPPWTVS